MLLFGPRARESTSAEGVNKLSPPARPRGAQALTTRPIPASRVFSMLKAMLGDQQSDSMADYIQTAIMLRTNKRPVG